MKQQTLEAVKEIVMDNSDAANALNNQMLKLDVIQASVAKVLINLDNMFENEAIKDTGATHLLLNQIRENVRLIDMAFYPLTKEIQEEVVKVNYYADELFNSIVKVDSE